MVAIGQRHAGREAPIVFKNGDRYFMVTSGCTGWIPNQAEYAVTPNVLGPWKVMGNPCVGPDSQTTFCSQGTFVFQVKEMPGAYIFMADRWKPDQLSESTYVWLPLLCKGNNIRIQWLDQWDLTYFKNCENIIQTG